MVPYALVILFGIVGAFSAGIPGLFFGIAVGMVSVHIIGWFVGKAQGGMLPRSVRDETATDFSAEYPGLVRDAYPSKSPYEAKEAISRLLDTMFRQANSDNSSFNVTKAGNPDVFFPSAMKVADEQATDAEREMAHMLARFLVEHPRWYGS